MRKLVSILTVLAIVFTFAAIPAMAAETITSDYFTAETNLAKGKTITSTVADAEWWTANMGPTSGLATDGNIATGIKTGYNATAKTPDLTLDLGGVYDLTSVEWYVWSAIKIYTNEFMSVYAGLTKDLSEENKIEVTFDATLTSTELGTGLTNGNGNICRIKATGSLNQVRYITLKGTYADTSKHDYRIFEVYAAGTASTLEASNVAGNIISGEATAVSADITQADTANVTDGSIETTLTNTAAEGVISQLTYDLGEDWATIDSFNGYILDKIKIFIPDTTEYEPVYEIYTANSADGTGAALAATTALDTAASDGVYTLIADISSANGRYVIIKAADANKALTVNEIVVTKIPDLKTGNLALNVTASKGGTWWSTTNTASTNDGDITGTITSRSGTTYLDFDYVQYDLGAVYDITGIVTYTGTGFFDRNHDIYGSVDGTSFYKMSTTAVKTREAVSVEGTNYTRITHTVNLFPARYIRVQTAASESDATQAASNWGLSEVSVYGTAFGENIKGSVADIALAEGTSIASMYVINTGAEKAGVVYVAAYKDSKLVDVAKVSLTAASGAITKTDVLELDTVSVPSQVRGFFFDGNLVPIINPVNLK